MKWTRSGDTPKLDTPSGLAEHGYWWILPNGNMWACNKSKGVVNIYLVKKEPEGYIQAQFLGWTHAHEFLDDNGNLVWDEVPQKEYTDVRLKAALPPIKK